MPVATKLMGKLNDASFAALTGTTNVTPYQGRVRIPDTTDFESSVRGLDPESECIAVTWVGSMNKRPLENGTAEVIVLLFFNLPKDSSSDCNKMYDLVDDVVKALCIDATWEDIGVKATDCVALRVEDGLQDDLVEWRVIVSLSIPPAC